MVNAARDMIEKDFRFWYSTNDLAHRKNHFVDVENTALEINRRLDLGVDPFLIMLVAWFHDLFAWSRQDHHEKSCLWVLESGYPLLNTLSKSERSMVALACLEHRSTYSGKYSSVLSELMSAADRGNPNSSVELALERSINYQITARGVNPVIARQDAIKHLKDKMGTNGYARYNGLYLLAFKEEIDKFRRAIDALQ